VKKSGKMALLILPFLLTYLFQATQYARAPVKYGYYVVYAKNADIALIPGSDQGPDGQPLLRNATIQQGLYNLTLGNWGPGYRVNYTDAFHVRNNEAFTVRLISLNFSSDSKGQEYMAIYVNVTGSWRSVWVGNETGLPSDSTSYIDYAPNSERSVMISIRIPENSTDLDLGPAKTALAYGGALYFWFTSAY